MDIIIRSNGTLSIYEQITNQMKNAIITGELSPGEALMSIRALAAKLGVSVITTKKAYELLEQESLFALYLAKDSMFVNIILII